MAKAGIEDNKYCKWSKLCTWGRIDFGTGILSCCIVLQTLHVNGSKQHDNKKRPNRESDRKRERERERERVCKKTPFM